MITGIDREAIEREKAKLRAEGERAIAEAKAERRDAARYRVLRATEMVFPWADVLGPHKTLDSFADALVEIADATKALAVELTRGSSA